MNNTRDDSCVVNFINRIENRPRKGQANKPEFDVTILTSVVRRDHSQRVCEAGQKDVEEIVDDEGQHQLVEDGRVLLPEDQSPDGVRVDDEADAAQAQAGPALKVIPDGVFKHLGSFHSLYL